MHEKCNQIAPIFVLCYINFGNVPKFMQQSTTIGAISLHFSCVSGPEMHEKCNEIAPIVVLCYINFGNIPKIYLTKYDDWCNFVAFFVHFWPWNARKMQRNCTNRRTLLYKFWERSQNLCNKVRRLGHFRCIFRAFQALKCTKNATKLHQSSYFVT